jgi:small subunit ribosomal protein S6
MDTQKRSYEIMFIVRPDADEEALDKLIEGFSKNITDGGGEIRSTEKMGRRRLAYTVRKFNDGFYVLLTIVAMGELIKEVERRLRVSEPVIKFLTVRIDEEEKRSTLPQVSAAAAAETPAETAAPEVSEPAAANA